MASKEDLALASLAAGFTLGFGFLTVWEAIKQTQQNRSPLRSAYIYMIWGEILANLLIGIVGWLFLGGVVGPSVHILLIILFLWVFEIQLLMQIIINRIAIIAESGATIARLKWGTAVVITMINIAVFCIWIPSHTIPPVSNTFVEINKYWDRVSKVLILLVDAGLNWYFLRTVQVRLVKHNGLTKYKPLVNFNMRLMIVSILMDIMLIGLMSLPNQVVYVQFHPVAYMVKLNIEMSMAGLITRLARGPQNDMIPYKGSSLSNQYSLSRHYNPPTDGTRGKGTLNFQTAKRFSVTDQTGVLSKDVDIYSPTINEETGGRLDSRIHRRTDIEVHVEQGPSSEDISVKDDTDSTRAGTMGTGDRGFDGADDVPLTDRRDFMSAKLARKV